MGAARRPLCVPNTSACLVRSRQFPCRASSAFVCRLPTPHPQIDSTKRDFNFKYRIEASEVPGNQFRKKLERKPSKIVAVQNCLEWGRRSDNRCPFLLTFSTRPSFPSKHRGLITTPELDSIKSLGIEFGDNRDEERELRTPTDVVTLQARPRAMTSVTLHEISRTVHSDLCSHRAPVLHLYELLSCSITFYILILRKTVKHRPARQLPKKSHRRSVRGKGKASGTAPVRHFLRLVDALNKRIGRVYTRD